MSDPNDAGRLGGSMSNHLDCEAHAPMSSSWLQPHLVTVLKTRLPVLQRWRSQTNLQGQIKNLENWILVELTHQLLDSGAARVVLTNGFFANGQDVLAPKRVASKDVPDLHGRKSKAIYLSADLSVRPDTGTPDDYWIAELKTGIAGMELLDDLRLVRFYCGAAGLAIRTRSELAWVVISPEPEAHCRAVKKAFNKICGRLKAEPGGCTMLTENIEDWLWATVVIPTPLSSMAPELTTLVRP